MRAIADLFNHAAETAREFREINRDRTLIEGGGGAPAAAEFEVYVVGFSSNNARLSCKMMDADRQPTGDAFEVYVESFNKARQQRTVDLNKGKSAPGFIVGNTLWVKRIPDGNLWWIHGYATEAC